MGSFSFGNKKETAKNQQKLTENIETLQQTEKIQQKQ